MNRDLYLQKINQLDYIYIYIYIYIKIQQLFFRFGKPKNLVSVLFTSVEFAKYCKY